MNGMTNKNFNPRDILELGFKHWRKIAVILGLSVMTVGVTSLLDPSVYEASTKIFIGRAHSRVTALTPLPMLSQAEEINSELEVIRSRALAERVYERLQREAPRVATNGSSPKFAVLSSLKIWLFGDGRSNETEQIDKADRAIKQLQRNLEAEPIKGSNVIHVRYRGETDARTAQILQMFIEEYVKLHMEIHSLAPAESFFEDKIVRAKAKLDSLEDTLRMFKEREGMIAYETQESKLVEQMEHYRQKLTELEMVIATQETLLARTAANVESGSFEPLPLKSIAEHPRVVKLKDRITELKLERNGLLREYTEAYPPVKSLGREIRLAEKELHNQIATLLEEEGAFLTSLKAERDALKSTLTSLQRRARGLPETELVINRLNLAIQNYRDLYSLLLKKHEEIQISEVNDARTVSIKPLHGDGIAVEQVGPKRARNVALAGILGLFFSFGLIFMLEYFNPTVRNTQDCESLFDLPVLESVPETKDDASFNLRSN